MTASVFAVHRSEVHAFSKTPSAQIVLDTGLGVRGDAHAGVTVKHRSRVARDPSQPNLRQVHLIDTSLLAELAAQGFAVNPGALGENVTTTGMDLLTLPKGARLVLGTAAVVGVTGLRNPCVQIERFQTGLLRAVLERTAAGEVIRKAGVMCIVVSGGVVRPGDPIEVSLPPGPRRPLEVV